MTISPEKDSTASEAIPRISLITTCKNRLHHLRQTLPLMVKQQHVEVIVVDYGCPEGTGDWVAENFPDVRIVRIDDDPGFWLTRARNRGAKAARGDYLLFVDADILLDVDIGHWAATGTQPGYYYRAPPACGPTAWGTFLCAKADFFKVGGFDEAFRRWGGEDLDLYTRLDGAGVEHASLPEHCLRAIEHGNDERAMDGFKARMQILQINMIYSQARSDITRLLGHEPDLASRIQLMKLITEKTNRFFNGGGRNTGRIKIPIDRKPKGSRHIHLHRTLVYTLTRPEMTYTATTARSKPDA